MLKQQQLSLSDEEDKNLASTSRTVSVDDNTDIGIPTGEDTSIGCTISNQAAIIKRYKMERKNSQQSHCKVVFILLIIFLVAFNSFIKLITNFITNSSWAEWIAKIAQQN